MDGVLEPSLLALFGVFVGFAGGYAGVGGAPLLVAAMVLFLGYDQHVAQGTVLAVMLGPMSLPGVIVMWDRVKLLKVEVVLAVVAYALFSNVGARVAYTVETQVLQLGFGLLLVLLGLKYLVGSSRATTGELDPDKVTIGQGFLAFKRPTVTILASMIGVVGGLFGIGAGVLMVPLFIGLFALHKDDARALSLAILLPPVSVGAILEYSAQGGVDWTAALIILVAYVSTNLYGAKLGRAHDTRLFLKSMGLLLFVLGLLDVAAALIHTFS
jgi:uncharacterized membrane protein YfcA